MAKRTKEALNIMFLTMDFSNLNPDYYPLDEEDSEIINIAIKQFNADSVFTICNCEDLYYKVIGSNPNEGSAYSPYTLLRLLIYYLPNVPSKLLYLDCDTMICGDIKELYDIDITGKEFAVCHDYLGKFWMNKDYFNAGVMLLNIDEIRKTKLFDKCTKSIKERKAYFSDQAVLNKYATNFIYFPDEFRFNEQRDIKPNTVVKHFCKGIRYFPYFTVYNVKQWDIDKVHSFLHINTFDEDYEYFKKIKSSYTKKKEEAEKLNNDKYIIQIKNLKKYYNQVKAVDDVSFNVKRGSLFAFLGVNGAGKSTTINIISSILSKNSGKVYIDGFDLDVNSNAIKQKIGIVFQNSVLDNLLTVEENLKIRGHFYGMTKKERNERFEEIVTLLDLKPILNRQVRKLSGGQKRRVDIARSMIHQPNILILDEPTTGLDPKTRQTVWRLIDHIRSHQQMTVFLTTHYLEEAEQATDVVIMDHGKIIAEGTPTALKNKYSSDYILIYTKKDQNMEEAFKGEKFEYIDDSSCYKVFMKNSTYSKDFLIKHKDIIKDFEIKKGDMDDVFLNVTGQKMKGGISNENI